MLKTAVLTGGVEIIERLSTEWSALCDEGPCNEPFLRPEWFAAFVRNFEKKVDLLTVRREGKLRAVLPLVNKKGTLHGVPVRMLQAVFNLNSPRVDLIHGADESERRRVVNAVWGVVKVMAGWDLLEIRLVKTDSWLADLLRLASNENYKTGIWTMDAAPYITLPQSIDTQKFITNFFNGPRKHLRQELDRRLRRLKELGSVEFVSTPGCTPGLTKKYFDLEAKGWKGRNGTAVTNDPAAARLHEEFAGQVAARHSLFIYELRLNGTTIAMSLNIRCGRKTIHWKTSYDEDYARYSPGNLLFRQLLIDCINSGSSEIDFLSPATRNKRVWAKREREHAALYVFAPGIFGSVLWTWKFSIISELRQFKGKLPGKMIPAHAQK